jgi:hypothetical protein
MEKIADSTYAPNPFGAVALRSELTAKIAHMKVDASIEGRELSLENIFYQRLTG